MASTLKICSQCRRHLMAPEPGCPFCGADLPMAPHAPGRRRVQVMMLGLTIALGGVGCGPGAIQDLPADPTGSDDGPSPSAMTTAQPGSTGTTMIPDPDSGGEVSTGTDTTTTGDTNDADDDWGCGFYAGCAPDGGGVAFECDIFAQDCPEGEKCMPWANTGGGSWNATRCTEIDDDPDQVGEPCTVEGSGVSGIDSCALGHMCFGVDPKTNEGECVAMCTGDESDPQCEDAATSCLISNDGALVLCMPTCDPVLQDCDDGDGCYPESLGDEFFCLHSSNPETVYGDKCEYANSCSPGQQCISWALLPDCQSFRCCSDNCSLDDVNADADCAALEPGQVCIPWYQEGEAPEGLAHVGVCGLDPA